MTSEQWFIIRMWVLGILFGLSFGAVIYFGIQILVINGVIP